MKVFHDRLSFDKETDEKFRWKTSVRGVEFKIYITQDRVPNPVPQEIEASVFEADSLFTYVVTKLGKKLVSELTDQDKTDLESIGVKGDQLCAAGESALLGAVWNPHDDHTETVRYNAYRVSEDLEFGDPYIPKSLLRRPYPERLLFLIRWIT